MTEQILQIKIIEAKDIIATDHTGKSDPYVKIALGHGKSWESKKGNKTTVKDQTLHPVWNETFELVVKDVSKQSLKFELFDKDKYASIPFLSVASGLPSLFSPRPLYKGIPEAVWAPIILKGKIQGRLHFSLTAKNFGLAAPQDTMLIVEVQVAPGKWEKRTFSSSPFGSTVNVFTLSDSKHPVDILDFRFATKISESEDDEGRVSLSIKFTKPDKEYIVSADPEDREWLTTHVEKHMSSGDESEIDSTQTARGLSIGDLHSLWAIADDNEDGSLDFPEIKRLVKSLNMQFSKGQLRALFKKIDKDGNKSLDFNEFCEFIASLRARPDVIQLFTSNTVSSTMSVADFKIFLEKNQKETLHDDQVLELIQALEGEPSAKALSLVGFSSYLCSSEKNGILDVAKLTQPHDMTQPMPHYYISSSHNTYLTGDQLKSKSSVEQYENVLLSGCRCVELDVWDGEDKEPIVYHGHTLTSKLLFKDILERIKKSGFTNSPYPIILSFETHCGIEGQKKMAHYCKEILGDLMPANFDYKTNILSPEQLKHKVLIKTKRLSEKLLPLAKAEQEEPAANPAAVAAVSASPVPIKKSSSSSLNKSRSGSTSKDKKKSAIDVAYNLSIITHLGSSGFKGFEDGTKKPYEWVTFSFSEGEAAKHFRQSFELLKWTQGHIARIYPAGGRVGSSNYDPVPHWVQGSQLVALNWQTFDRSTRCNDAIFAYNNKMGYVLKPESILKPIDSASVPYNRSKPSRLLRVYIISGWQLPKSVKRTQSATAITTTNSGKMDLSEVSDPYCRLVMHGVEGDKSKAKTKVVSNNGFNPVWNEKFEFKLRAPELAILSIEVYDEDKMSKNDLLGYFDACTLALRPGYRTIALKGKNREAFAEASLLVKIEWEPIPAK